MDYKLHIPSTIRFIISLSTLLITQLHANSTCATSLDSKLTVKKALITISVNGKTPGKETISVPPSTQHLYAFTELNSIRSDYIVHSWYHNGRHIRDIKLSSNPPNWKTFSLMKVKENTYGQWKVIIKDSKSCEREELTTYYINSKTNDWLIEAKKALSQQKFHHAKAALKQALSTSNDNPSLKRVIKAQLAFELPLQQLQHKLSISDLYLMEERIETLSEKASLSINLNPKYKNLIQKVKNQYQQLNIQLERSAQISLTNFNDILQHEYKLYGRFPKNNDTTNKLLQQFNEKNRYKLLEYTEEKETYFAVIEDTIRGVFYSLPDDIQPQQQL